jgi:hypothetical protein
MGNDKDGNDDSSKGQLQPMGRWGEVRLN